MALPLICMEKGPFQTDLTLGLEIHVESIASFPCSLPRLVYSKRDFILNIFTQYSEAIASSGRWVANTYPPLGGLPGHRRRPINQPRQVPRSPPSGHQGNSPAHAGEIRTQGLQRRRDAFLRHQSALLGTAGSHVGRNPRNELPLGPASGRCGLGCVTG